MSKSVQIVIAMDENNNVSVSGPIADKVTCYGLLALAHDVIKDFNDKVEKKPALDIVGTRALKDVALNGRSDGR